MDHVCNSEFGDNSNERALRNKLGGKRDLSKGSLVSNESLPLTKRKHKLEEFHFMLGVLPIWCAGTITYFAFFRTVSDSILRPKIGDRLFSESSDVGLFLTTYVISIVLSQCVNVPFYTGQQRFTLKMGFLLLYSCTSVGLLSTGENIHLVLTNAEYGTRMVGMLFLILLMPQICILIIAVRCNNIRLGLREWYDNKVLESRFNICSYFWAMQILWLVVVMFIIHEIRDRVNSSLEANWKACGVLVGLSTCNFLYFTVCCQVAGPSLNKLILL